MKRTVKSFILICALQVLMCHGMNISRAHKGIVMDYDKELGRSSAVPEACAMERAVYASLSREPFTAEVPCLAVRWSAYVADNKFAQRVRNLRLQCPGGVTMCVHESFRKVVPELRKIDIKYLLTVQCPRGEYEGLTIVPILYPINQKVPAAAKKDLLYSFVGARTCALRDKVLRLRSRRDVKIIKRPQFTYFVHSASTRARWMREYNNIMSRSRFSLCPRGNSLNTMRLTESFCAGAIPVVMADGICLPAGFDWSSCLVRVPEKDVHKVDEILRAIPLEREQQMRQACLELGQQLKRDPAYFVRYYFDKVLGKGGVISQFAGQCPSQSS